MPHAVRAKDEAFQSILQRFSCVVYHRDGPLIPTYSTNVAPPPCTLNSTVFSIFD